jgi:hypothetical protein
MSISKPTPRIAESFIGSSSKPTWKQLKCIYALNGGKSYDKPKSREEASQMIQKLKSGSKFGKGKTGFQLVSDLAELKSEVNSEIAKPVAKPATKPATKMNRATLRQKLCIYAICMTLWNDKTKAKQVSNLVRSRDEASQAIQELKRLQN